MALRIFLVRRLALFIPLLLGILLFTFFLVRIGGQDPVGLIAGPTATTGEIARIRAELGLDQPILTQFWIYLGHVLEGDLGRSWISQKPVLRDVLDRFPITLELLLWGTLIGSLVAVPVGLRAAFRHDGAFDIVSRSLSLLGFSIPTYFLGLLMLFVFFYLLEWAPPGMGRLSLMVTPPPTVTGSYLIDSLLAGNMEGARSALSQLVLPVLCIAIISAAPIAKHTRAIALEVMGSDYVRYADATGLDTAARTRIVLRNSRTPILTFVGTELTGLIGTAALIEYVFAWGGLGQYGLNAIIRGDFTAVQGYVLALALFSLLVFLVIDVLVLLFDPRTAEQP